MVINPDLKFDLESISFI